LLFSQALALDESEAALKRGEKPAAAAEDRSDWPLGKIEPVLEQEAESAAMLNVIIYLGGADIPRAVESAKQEHMESIEGYSNQLRQFQKEWRESRGIESLTEEEEKELAKSAAVKSPEEMQTAEALDEALSDMRKSVAEAVQNAVKASQEEIVGLIKKNGGTVTNRIALVNAVAATIPSQALAVIAGHPLVHTIVKDRPTEYELNVSVPALEYNEWWNDGIDGGVWDFGIPEGVQTDHPALTSHSFYGRSGSSAAYHGTHVTGIVASTNSTYRGGAYDLDSIIWANTGSGQSGTFSNMEWMVTSAADDPEVVNHSLGYGIATSDYVTNDSFYDAYVPTYAAMVTK
jgi:hypothetical protein